MFNVDQLDRPSYHGDGDDVVAVEIAVEDPGRNGVAIQTNQEIKEGRLVTDDDGFLMMLLREDLF